MCCSYFFQCFDAVYWATGRHPACKKSCTSSPRGYLLKDLWGTGLSWIDMVKIGRIEKKVSVYIMCCQY